MFTFDLRLHGSPTAILGLKPRQPVNWAAALSHAVLHLLYRTFYPEQFLLCFLQTCRVSCPNSPAALLSCQGPSLPPAGSIPEMQVTETKGPNSTERQPIKTPQGAREQSPSLRANYPSLRPTSKSLFLLGSKHFMQVSK